MKHALANLTYGLRKVLPPIDFLGVRVPMRGDHVSRGVWKRVFRGDYEKPEVDALLALLRSDDRVLELGTGMGLVSGLAAKRYPALRVETYEANPHMIPVIRDFHALNEITNVNLHNAILVNGEADGTRPFYLHRSFAQSSLVPSHDTAQASVEVPEKDVKRILTDFRPTILLCDIEGGEAELFRGLDLSVLRAAIVELHPNVISRRAEADIYDAFAASGLYLRIDLCSGTVAAFEAVQSHRS